MTGASRSRVRPSCRAGSIVTSVSPDPIRVVQTPASRSARMQPSGVVIAQRRRSRSSDAGHRHRVDVLPAVGVDADGRTVDGGGSAAARADGTCSVTYTRVDRVTLTATPASGYTLRAGREFRVRVPHGGRRGWHPRLRRARSRIQTTYRLTGVHACRRHGDGRRISCGTSGTGTCSVTFTTSTPVTLTATPDLATRSRAGAAAAPARRPARRSPWMASRPARPRSRQGSAVGPPVYDDDQPSTDRRHGDRRRAELRVGGAVCSYTGRPRCPTAAGDAGGPGQVHGLDRQLLRNSASTYVALSWRARAGRVHVDVGVVPAHGVDADGGTVTGAASAAARAGPARAR